jgi:hypothetical protein
MKEFIERNSRLLRAYCFIARVIGWFLILGGIVWIFAVEKGFQSSVENSQVEADFWFNTFVPIFGAHLASSFLYDFVIPGFLAFAVGGLLDCLLRPKNRVPLILGMMDKLCYVYAVILIMKAFIAYNWLDKFLAISESEMSGSARIILMQPLFGPTLAKVLLLIGVGMILHRLLPVIEESKTLV